MSWDMQKIMVVLLLGLLLSQSGCQQTSKLTQSTPHVKGSDFNVIQR